MASSQQLILGTGTAVNQYQIQRSLRFNSADSAYLNRTPASAGNRQIWTWSGWVKLSSNKAQQLFTCVGSQTDTTSFFIDMLSSGVLRVLGWTTVFRSTSAVYRDFSAWYHIVVALDTTQATANDRIKVYVNGSQVTAFATTNNPTQNSDLGINQASLHEIGRYSIGATGYDYLDGYMTNVNFIDGQALTPSSFGETNADTGVWQPKAYSGTFGTNGFQLLFADNSGTTSTTLGKDTSGNGNNWTPNNFSVTAGTGNDSLVDTPTPYGTDTGAGGEVRGNYCTLNPLRNGLTLSNGNLAGTITTTGAWRTAAATFGISSGKWYWEGTCTKANDNQALIGIINANASVNSYAGVDANGYAYYTDGSAGYKITVANPESYGASFTTNDVIGVALDMDAGTLVFYKNGVSQGTAYSSLTGTWFPSASVISSSAWNMNFGQRPFAYTAPSGFKALVTQNLPTPTVIQGDDYFNAGLYTGTGSSSPLAVSGPPNPDFVWIKARSQAYSHSLLDRLRDAADPFSMRLYSNGTDVEYDYGSSLLSTTSTGFNLTTTDGDHNNTGVTYVAWQWKANGAGSSNTAGTISSTVSANTTSGFSIVTYTGNGSAGATVGHGLGATPGMIIIKCRNNPYNWAVWQTSLGGGNNALQLNSSNAKTSAFNYWNSTNPGSSVFTLGNDNGVNQSSATYVAYCFAPVAGYSAFGSYTGNGSTDGPFIYTGFRPAYILLKADAAGYNWDVIDSKRNTYNVVNNHLFPDTSGAEQTLSTNQIDFVSNGFKNRTGNFLNVNNITYVYAAFAENPFKYALAR